MNKLFKITIGIPAHNEENNIGELLDSLSNQDQSNFILEKIIVILDGSTDNTEKVVKEKIKQNKNIYLINDKKRKGKLKRLEQIYSLSRSEILICFDGDVVPVNKYLLTEITTSFSGNKTSLVGIHAIPVKSDTLVGKILLAWNQVWHEAKLNYKSGNNMYNFKGCALALRKDFYKKILPFPKGVLSDSQYIYLLAKKLNLEIYFNKKAQVLYRKPQNLKDYYMQMNRAPSEKYRLSQIFGNWIKKEYKIPRKIKYRALITRFLKNPFYTFLGSGFFIFDSYFHKNKKNNNSKSYWSTTSSTKSKINT